MHEWGRVKVFKFACYIGRLLLIILLFYSGAVLVLIPSNTSASTYDSISIPCVAFGSPLPQIIWRKNGAILSNDAPVISIVSATVTTSQGRQFAVSTLNLCGLRSSDAAMYSCSVQSAPNDQFAFLTGVQSAPFSISVSVGGKF